MTKQYLDDPEKSGRLGYVKATTWATKGLFLLFPLSSSNQALSRPLRPLFFFPLVYVCVLPTRGWEYVDVCVGWRVLRVGTEKDPNYQRVNCVK